LKELFCKTRTLTFESSLVFGSLIKAFSCDLFLLVGSEAYTQKYKIAIGMNRSVCTVYMAVLQFAMISLTAANHFCWSLIITLTLGLTHFSSRNELI